MWDTFVVYGSFTDPHPDEESHDIIHRFPQKFDITDKLKGEFFAEKYFYINIETEIDIDISITAISKELPIGQIKSIKLLNFINELRTK